MNEALLVDERFGIVLGLHRKHHRDDEPAALLAFHGRVNNSRKLGQWYGDRISLGSAFYDAEAARRAAIGEAVERYCGNFVPRGLQKASYEALAAAGELAIDPTELALYSPRQHATRGFPFVPFTRTLEVYWAAGRRLSDGSPAWVPASLVYPNYFVDRLAHEPRTHFVNLAGIAAGASREDAERSALEEIVERDAISIWWLSGGSQQELDWRSEPRLAAAMAPRDPATAAPEYRVFAIANGCGVPVIAAVLRDGDGIVTLGAASRPDPVDAAAKALTEAVHLRGYSRELLQQDGKIWQLMKDGILDQRVYKAYREDRSYRDAYRSDWRDVVDLGCHAQIYLDPRMAEHLSRFEGGAPPLPCATVPAFSAEERRDLRAAYLARLAAEGLSAYSVDVTTPDVAAAGLSVVRAVVPGMVGNAPAAFPPLGGRRLYEEPRRHGWRTEYLREDDVVLAPIPHT